MSYLSSKKNKISILTGRIWHGFNLPLPAGYSIDQCSAFVSLESLGRDRVPISSFTHSNFNVTTINNKFVVKGVSKAGSAWTSDNLNFIVIGIK